jgi:AcrR family transcriptional regulator
VARPPSAAAHQALADAIDDVLYEHGLHEGTVDEICRRASVSKPAFYRHFGDRERMVVDYLARRRDRRRILMQQAVDAAGLDARSRIAALIEWICEWITSPEFRGCGFHRAVQQRPSDLEELVAITVDQKAWMEQLLHGEFARLDANPEPLARHVFLLIEGSMAVASYRNPAAVATDLRVLSAAVMSALS